MDEISEELEDTEEENQPLTESEKAEIREEIKELKHLAGLVSRLVNRDA